MYYLSYKEFCEVLQGRRYLETSKEEFCSVTVTEMVDERKIHVINVLLQRNIPCNIRVLSIMFTPDITREQNLILILQFLGYLGARNTDDIKFLEIKGDNFTFIQTQKIYNVAKACKISVNVDVVKHFVEDIAAKGFRLKPKTALIGVQHFLETTSNLVEAIISLGITPQNIFLLGKDYSTTKNGRIKLERLGINLFDSGHYDFASDVGHPDKRYQPCAEIMEHCVQSLWDLLRKRVHEFDFVIILDDGGRCHVIPEDLKRSHLKFVGVEQTTKGLRMLPVNASFPIISVASSYAKREIEYLIAISTSIVAALEKHLSKIPNFPNRNRLTLGIVGYGNNGRALFKTWREQGWKNCIVCDFNPSVSHDDVPTENFFAKFNRAFIDAADVIIGCTGEDIIKALIAETPEAGTITSSGKTKYMASGSSEDVEFLSLLMREIVNIRILGQQTPRFANLHIPTCTTLFGHDIVMINAGFPLNFGESSEYEYTPVPEIYLTRLLLISAVIQAVIIGSDPHDQQSSYHLYTLHPYIQNYLVGKWLQYGGIITHDYEKKLGFLVNFAHDSFFIEEQSAFRHEAIVVNPCSFWTPPQSLSDFADFRFKIDDISRYFNTYGFSEGQLREFVYQGVRLGEEQLITGMMNMLVPTIGR